MPGNIFQSETSADYSPLTLEKIILQFWVLCFNHLLLN